MTRHLEATARDLLEVESTLILGGARSVGKSTLSTACAASAGVEVIDLDDTTVRGAVRSDPRLFIADSSETVFIDEFQYVPAILDEIKRELGRDLRPGRFMLTGSTRYASLPKASQSLTGRAHLLRMWPLSQGELRGRRETFLDLLLTSPSELVIRAESTTNRGGYEEMVLAGGFPLALQREPEHRSRWFRDLVDLVITRDVLQIRKVRQSAVLPQILRLLAAQTAQLLNTANVASKLRLNEKTVGDFVRLLEAVFLIHRLEAFGRSDTTRVMHSPKVHMVDSGLAAHQLRINQSRLAARSPSALSEFGHVVETFAVNEVIKQAGWSDEEVTFSHLRTRNAQEVDLVCETADGRLAGVEVKSSASISDADFSGLRFMQGRYPDEFVGGVVLYLGNRSYRKQEGLYAIPMDALWR